MSRIPVNYKKNDRYREILLDRQKDRWIDRQTGMYIEGIIDMPRIRLTLANIATEKLYCVNIHGNFSLISRFKRTNTSIEYKVFPYNLTLNSKYPPTFVQTKK